MAKKSKPAGKKSGGKYKKPSMTKHGRLEHVAVAQTV